MHLTGPPSLLQPLLAVAEGEAPAGPSNVGLGSVVLTIAIVAFLAWIGYLVISSRRKRAAEEVPKNLQPYLSDDELENKRLTRVLGAAVVVAGVLALSLPVYYVDEASRQARAAEGFAELDIEEGEKWWEKFSCTECHGPLAGGGGATFIEKRSGLEVTWSAPSLNDVYFRFSPEEIRQVIVHGRDGTPMPANGLEGGGAMTVQEVDQVMAFLEHLQISQAEVLAETEAAVSTALDRIRNGDTVVDRLVVVQEARLADVLDAPDILARQSTFIVDTGAFTSGGADPSGLRLNEAVDIFISRAGNCTDESAALAGTVCELEGEDSDRDGITDGAERFLTAVAALAHDTLTGRVVEQTAGEDGVFDVSIIRDGGYDIAFDPATGFTNANAVGTPIADIEVLGTLIGKLDLDILNTSVVAERQDRFVASIESTLDFLNEAAAERGWVPQGATVSADSASYTSLAESIEGSVDLPSGLAKQGTFNDAQAERAAGLFNAYCARCHIAGYSAGVAFEQGPGSGAWGPALLDGRAVIQFPDPDDHVNFVIRGTEFGVNYGINGLGSGRMPGFGQILTVEDIELIVAYERSL